MQKPAHVPRVGVFVDDMPQNIVTRVYNYGLDYVQLHGDESRITCDNLRRTIDPTFLASIVAYLHRGANCIVYKISSTTDYIFVQNP